MEVLTRSEVQMRLHELLTRVREGEIFIHPTDTIYGIGCNAQSRAAVRRIRRLKERPDAPFSIWIPSKGWVLKHCDVPPEMQPWLEKLPGAYTFITKLKDTKAIAEGINPANRTVGVRLPDHWFAAFVERLGVPIVTTSVNRSGRRFMTSLEDIDTKIKNGVRFAVYEGEKHGRPSTVVDLTEGGAVKER